jgi:hypothetical protein
MTYSILDFSTETLKTFTHATSLESFAKLIFQYEKKTENCKASDLIKAYSEEFSEDQAIPIDEVAATMAGHLVHSKHHLVVNRRSANNEENKAICEALEAHIDRVIKQLQTKKII